MRYCYLIALTIGLAMPTVSTFSDEPTADQRLAADSQTGQRPQATGPSKAFTCPPGPFGESGMIRFRLLSGRLQLDPMQYRKGSREHHCDRYQESMTVSAMQGIPCLVYTFRDHYQKIRVVGEHGQQLIIESTLLATGETAQLTQNSKGRLQWQTRRRPGTPTDLDTTIQGDTLLHIAAQDRSGFEIHLAPITTRMLRGRSLIDIIDQTHQHLRDQTATLAVVPGTRLDRLIDGLASKKCSVRRDSFGQLAGMGTLAIAKLRSVVERDQLDPQQKVLVQQLIRRQPRLDDDTPESLAMLLAGDRLHWQNLSNQLSQSEWLAANDHVQRCGLQPLARR